jgi:predicted PurR-regulated permease PerM
LDATWYDRPTDSPQHDCDRADSGDAYALFLSARILIVLFVAIIVASAVRPAVLWLEERRIPKALAIVLIYFIIAVGIFTVAILVVPPSINRVAGYITNEDRLANRIIAAHNWIEMTIEQRTGSDVTLLDPESIRLAVTNIVEDLRRQSPALLGEAGALIGDFILVVVMGVYWLTSRDDAVEFNTRLFPIGRRTTVTQIITEIEHSMGAYVRGIVLVSTFVGVANYVVLSILGVPNPLTSGFIIGVTTAIPIIGGYIGAAAVILLAILSSPLHALLAFASFVAIQQIENHYLTPRVMSNSVGLNPILIIVFLFVGFALGGVIGGLIAVPIMGTVMIIRRHLVIEPRQAENAPQYVEGGVLIAGGDVNGLAQPAGPEVGAPSTGLR